MNKEIIRLIQLHYHNAVSKHPHFADSLYHAMCILTEEVGEVAKAINDSNKHHIKEEILDTIAVCIRIIQKLD
ncbi:MAG: MazG nucleotide pyrophosphohydrolase domain-containing protein [Chitinophagaceae bacterium]